MVAPFDKRPVSVAATRGSGVAGVGDLVGLAEIVVFGTAVVVDVTVCSSISDFLNVRRDLTNNSATSIIFYLEKHDELNFDFVVMALNNF